MTQVIQTSNNRQDKTCFEYTFNVTASFEKLIHFKHTYGMTL
jgi:hypothetical protein